MSNSTYLNPGVVVITGGGGGVGLAAATVLAPQHPVLLADRNEEHLKRTLGHLSSLGLAAEGVVCDVADSGSVARLADRAAALGPISLLLHTAGLSPSMAGARKILEVNLMGTANVLARINPLLGEGSVVVLIASMAAHRGRAYEFDHLLDGPVTPASIDALVDAAADQSRPAYALSKRFAVLTVERSARELGRRGIRIVSVSPGLIDTEMGRLESGSATRGNPSASMSVAAIERLASPEEVAWAAIMLADHRSCYTTGTDLLVDGGSIAGFRHHADAAIAESWNDPWT